MLNLTNVRNLLSQVLELPALHTAVLFTPQGELISYSADAYTPKDHVRVVVGLGGEVWQETKTQGIGMVASEVGRIVVLPVGLKEEGPKEEGEEDDDDPFMLLAVNADDSVPWSELESKARELVRHLERPIGSLRERLAASPVPLVKPRPERATR
ncbi:hypothetical protein BKA93DRAFT_732135 [Sparassis latifolia]|uniref:GAF domain-containing protein n=1 Tax=Sparassis crispa TaxID=139825 RepID=A0A401G5R0_9APHY|nr:hypothetical protein SCP_0103810 [Sparassis crispa]GBE77506.1 hypothetical protein SCP_0103810 [Sparassis crispa]